MDRIKKVCLLALAATLTAAIGFCLGWSIPRESRDADVAASASDFDGANAIDRFRTERQELRQMQISQLAEIIHGDDAELSSLAKRRQLELMDWSEKELTLEAVLSLRGFEDVLVTVHTDSVNVMVSADAVNQQQAAVILEAVTRETGISGGNVKIIPIN